MPLFCRVCLHPVLPSFPDAHAAFYKLYKHYAMNYTNIMQMELAAGMASVNRIGFDQNVERRLSVRVSRIDRVEFFSSIA